jgi:hypothetical protein
MLRIIKILIIKIWVTKLIIDRVPNPMANMSTLHSDAEKSSSTTPTK